MSWLGRLFDKPNHNKELEEEVRSHLEMAMRERTAQGESADESLRSARRGFGNVELVKEVTRDQWRWRWLAELLQDMRYGLRTMRKNPGFTSTAVLALVLGIGANTAIFSLVNGVLLRPLPYKDPDRLVGLTTYYPEGPFVVMRDQSQTMDIIANSDGSEFNLSGVDLPVRLIGSSVSAGWFTVLGVQPEMGRVFQEGEDQPGKDLVVVLSHATWQKRFAGDPNIIGRTIILEGAGRTVVGVMPPGFRYPSPKTELWVPLHLDPGDRGTYWGSSYMPLTARLRPGVTLEQALLELAKMRPAILAAFPWRMPDDTWKNSTVEPLHELVVGDVRAKLLVLFGAVGLLLLIACANVANLLLARATTRQKEIALRTALGAGRWRITRQLMTESVMVALLGGALGLCAAVYGLSLLKTTLPADTPRLADVSVDGRVLVFTALLAIVTGLVFGTAPSAGASRFDPIEALKSGGARTSTGGSHRLSRVLIVGEVAVSVVLVIGAGLLVKSLWNLSNARTGFRPEYILTARITPNESFCEVQGRCQAFYNDLLARARTLPGVKDAAVVNGLPLSTGWEAIPSDVEGYEIIPGAHVPMMFERIVSPGYLRMMGIPLLQGRELTEADTAPTAQRVLVVSKSTAERFWPGRNPIGEHIKPRWLKQWWTVVGVVGDVREYSLTRNLDDWLDGEIYTPYGPHSIRGRGPEAAPAEMTLLLRTSEDKLQLASELQSLVSSMNADVPVSQVETMRGWLAEAVAGPRSTALLFSLFAGLALALGAVGIYGVISYFVAQRTREIGIRIALGARREEVLLLVVGQGAKLALGGVFIGLLGALTLTRLMTTLLYRVGAADPPTYAGVALLLVLVAIAASYVPARRAMRVDPIVALRHE